MKLFNFIENMFFNKKKKKSDIYNTITKWELKYFYKSIKQNNGMKCPNCESNYLKYNAKNRNLYCDFCGQNYDIYKSNIDLLSITNFGIDKSFINLNK